MLLELDPRHHVTIAQQRKQSSNALVMSFLPGMLDAVHFGGRGRNTHFVAYTI